MNLLLSLILNLALCFAVIAKSTRACQNGGTDFDGRCSCVQGYTGNPCETCIASAGCDNKIHCFAFWSERVEGTRKCTCTYSGIYPDCNPSDYVLSIVFSLLLFVAVVSATISVCREERRRQVVIDFFAKQQQPMIVVPPPAKNAFETSYGLGFGKL